MTRGSSTTPIAQVIALVRASTHRCWACSSATVASTPGGSHRHERARRRAFRLPFNEPCLSSPPARRVCRRDLPREDASMPPHNLDPSSGAQRMSDSENSVDARLETFIRRMPKAEIHVHLEGSVRPATLLELARRNGVQPPAGDEAGLREFFRFRDFPQLHRGLHRRLLLPAHTG